MLVGWGNGKQTKRDLFIGCALFTPFSGHSKRGAIKSTFMSFATQTAMTQVKDQSLYKTDSFFDHKKMNEGSAWTWRLKPRQTDEEWIMMGKGKEI